MNVAGPTRPPLPSHPYDVIVIGGGVNGVAIARECAQAGKRVLLLEQNDFASGTSSRATRIIHGGLRYLEHGELGLVRESLRERDLLLRTKPHLVRTKRFILAVPEQASILSLRNPLALRAGMMLYRTLSGNRNRTPSAETEIVALERSLDSGHRWTVLDYEDAQCEFPERLIADWLVEAVACGAVARNHVSVLSVETVAGRATAVRTQDRLTGEVSRYSAQWIINATGPWADRVADASALLVARMIGGVRGSHIILPGFPGAPTAAVYAEAEDGRPIFVIPWNGQTLVGTTEVADSEDPASTAPTAAEVRYLMQSLLRTFPKAQFTAADITACYAGVRPLPFSSHGDASGITRKHFLHDHSADGAAGMISVIGGKLTTATSLARGCARAMGIPKGPLMDVAIAADGAGAALETLQPLGLPEITVRAIHDWHGDWPGGAGEQICRSAAESSLLAEPIAPGSSHIIAEAVHAARNELAVTLGDMLLRRVPVALAGDWSEQSSRIAAQRIGTALGWSEAHTELALEEFETERNAFLRKPADLPTA